MSFQPGDIVMVAPGAHYNPEHCIPGRPYEVRKIQGLRLYIRGDKGVNVVYYDKHLLLFDDEPED